MLVIAESGGKQYKMEVGKIIEVASLGLSSGEVVFFDKVLFCLDGDRVVDPSLVKVEGRVVANMKRDKIIAFKKQRRTSCFEKRRGYRPTYTSVVVDRFHTK